MDKKISVAIDGPAAAGKSTVAKIIAEKLSYIYIDTGAMYRALTLKALREKLNLEDEKKLLTILNETEIELQPGDDGQLVFLDGENVTAEIRSQQVSTTVSTVAKYEGVRREMVKRQQLLAKDGGVIMDGRDIGTHVLPNAEVKIFLLASVDERARRRYDENNRRGIISDLEQIKREITDRDKQDSERENSPLRKADDAIELDTTSLTIDQVAEEIMALVNGKVR